MGVRDTAVMIEQVRRRWLWGLLTALAVVGPAAARQEPAPPPALGVQAENLAVLTTGAALAPQGGPWCAATALLAGTHRDFRVWDLWGPLSSRHGRTQVGAQTLFLNGFTPAPGLPLALAQVGTLQCGNDREENDGCWNLLDTDVLRPFPPAFRDGRIVDGKGLFVGTLETEAYSDVLVQAHYTSTDAFRAGARRDLTYAQVFAEPRLYRGEVMHIEGRLARLARLDPPAAAQAGGVGDLYEAWIFHDAYGLNPFCA
jgi:hypothetical protein